MKTKNQIRSIDIYDSEASAWNLQGDSKELKFLRILADTYYLTTKRERPLSIILSGKQSTTLYSLCFLRALAMQISRIPAQMLYVRDGLIEFFTPTHADRGYIVEDVEHLNLGISPKLIQILQDGHFTQYDPCKKSIDSYPVFGIIIFTCKDIKQVIPSITKTVDHIITIEDLTQEQIKQVIKMRLSWANVGYESEKVIDLLAAGNSLRMIVSILRIAYAMMLFENRSVITEQDVLKAREYL